MEHKQITIPVGASDIDLPRLLVELGACASRSQAKRLIKQGAVSLDDKVLTNIIIDLPPEDIVIRCGKTFFRKLIAMRKTFNVEVNKEEGEARITDGH